MFKKGLKELFGRESTQRLFEWLRRASFVGLNIGQGGRVDDSGEAFVLRYVKKHVQSQNPLIFDVGANVGSWSLKALECFGETLILYAFEPSKSAFETLSERVKGPFVQLYPFGLGDQKQEMPLYSDALRSGIASLYDRRLTHFDVVFHPREVVSIETLDAFCSSHGISSIDFLKLDVEGHELSVLKGASHLLANRAIEFIQFEFGGCNIDSRTYFQDFYYLLHKDYKLFRVLHHGLHPIEEYREIDECFITTNYLARRRL